MSDIAAQLQEQVIDAYQAQTPLAISGGNSKAFLGHQCQGEDLSLIDHNGIINYEPDEVILTVRAGTSLQMVRDTLAEQRQMLAFEPPSFAPSATVGGMVACGLSGPARPYAGSVRDFVLGVRMINGMGELVSFGGQVIKNVAGYDVSRLQTGAMGTLGIILDVTFKVLPMPATSITLARELDPETAIRTMNELAGKPYPISAACFVDGTLFIRLSGAEQGVNASVNDIGGEVSTDAGFWDDIANQRHAFFQSTQSLWRISVPPATSPLPLSGKTLIDWGGASRWLYSDDDHTTIRRVVADVGGHATLFRSNVDNSVARFHPLSSGLLKLHHAVKQSFDPVGILNPGRLYPNL